MLSPLKVRGMGGGGCTQLRHGGPWETKPCVCLDPQQKAPPRRQLYPRQLKHRHIFLRCS